MREHLPRRLQKRQLGLVAGPVTLRQEPRLPDTTRPAWPEDMPQATAQARAKVLEGKTGFILAFKPSIFSGNFQEKIAS